MITEKERDAVADIISETLIGKFGDTFVFDPIVVKPAVDPVDGQEYLRIRVTFDGDRKLLDPKWTVGLIGRIRPKMAELGIYEFPSTTFAEKSEWEVFQAGEYFESTRPAENRLSTGA